MLARCLPTYSRLSVALSPSPHSKRSEWEWCSDWAEEWAVHGRLSRQLGRPSRLGGWPWDPLTGAPRSDAGTTKCKHIHAHFLLVRLAAMNSRCALGRVYESSNWLLWIRWSLIGVSEYTKDSVNRLRAIHQPLQLALWSTKMRFICKQYFVLLGNFWMLLDLWTGSSWI